MTRWLIVIAVAGAVAAGACVLAVRWLYPEVTVTSVVEGPVVQAFYATGTIQPVREYLIKSNAAGYLTQVLVDKGDVVSRDQPLAIVTEDAVQHRYEQAKADRDLKARLADEKTSPLLAELDARIAGILQLLELARREEQRISGALASGAASPSDLDRALDRIKTLLTEAEGLKAQRATRKLELERDLQVAEAALRIAQWNVDRQTIRSPIDYGSVLDRPLSVGTRVAANDLIMVIADVRPDRLVMRAAVDEEDKTSVRLGQTVHMTLYAFPGRVLEGRVQKIYDKADPARRTFEVDVDILNRDPGLAAGMTGELAFVIDRKDRAMVVPTQSVQDGTVWVVRGNQLARTEVQLGLRSVERTEVLSGLRADDRVVVSPLDNMQTGQRVRTRFISPREAADLNRPQFEGSPFRGFN